MWSPIQWQMWASSRPNKRRELDVQLLKQQISWLLEKKEVPTTLTRLTPPELLPSCWSHNSPLEGFLVDPDDYDQINDDHWSLIRAMMIIIDDINCLLCTWWWLWWSDRWWWWLMTCIVCSVMRRRGDDAVATSLPTSSTHTISSLWTYWWSLLIILDHIEYSWSSVAYW